MLSDKEMIDTWTIAKNETNMHLTFEQKVIAISRAILEADLKARQAAMVKGLNLLEVFDAASGSIQRVFPLGPRERVDFIEAVMKQITDFKTTPSTGPVPAIEKLEAAEVASGRNYTEAEHYVAEHMMQLGFEHVNDDATVYACTLDQVLALLTARRMPAWESGIENALPEDQAIRDAHPLHTKRHGLYTEAMRLVGARRTKGGLVELVNWLLYKLEVAVEEAAHHDFQHKSFFQATKVPDDFYSHRASWRRALEERMMLEPEDRQPTPESDGRFDRSYWQHELAAFDRAYGELLRKDAIEGDRIIGVETITHTEIDGKQTEVVVDNVSGPALDRSYGRLPVNIDDPLVTSPAVAHMNAFDRLAKDIKDVPFKSVRELALVCIKAGDMQLSLDLARRHLRATYGDEHVSVEIVDVTLMEYLVKIFELGIKARNSGPNIKITAGGRAVDQNYHWNYDMTSCPDGKVQLLSIGGIPNYGYKAHGPDFYRAWAAMPKDNGPAEAES